MSLTNRRVRNVLFVAKAGAARPVMAETILNDLSAAGFRAYSACIDSMAEAHPEVLALLRRLRHKAPNDKVKPAEDFAGQDAPVLDFIIALDDEGVDTRGFCQGQPIVCDWRIPNPEVATGNDAEIAVAFADTYRMLRNRIELLAALPAASLDRLAWKQRIEAIDDEADAGLAD
ncbi:MAG: arsenate reductase ArsC [Alphaproteobacteria bacterium]|nr:arsenate reductase ArsC [Alphaproteobacteria bacterium]